MYLAIPPQRTNATAWLSSVLRVNAAPGHEAFNVVIDIADPISEIASDEKIISLVNEFLKAHDAHPLQTVANTIFPSSTYKHYGSPEFYDVYLKKIYPKVKEHQWGRYFERMINYQAKDRVINPLAELIQKLKDGISEEKKLYRNIYELGIYDPALDIRIYDPVRDANRSMNRQCLSFLSFKLDREMRLGLTAVYRNHFYIARLLGNMIGLGRLLEFVATESDTNIGSLTIVSTHAEVDTFKWTREEVTELIMACEKAGRL